MHLRAMMSRKNDPEPEQQDEYPNDWLFRRSCDASDHGDEKWCVLGLRIVEVPERTRGSNIERLDLVYQVCTGDTVILGLPQHAGHLLARRLDYFFPTAP